MWLTVEHVTRFVYDEPVNEAFTELRLAPLQRDGQRRSSFTVTTEPQGRVVLAYTDRYGNEVRHFDVLEPHGELVVTARSEVLTPERFLADDGLLGLLDRYDYTEPSRFVPVGGIVGELAAEVAAEAGDDASLDTVLALQAAVRARLRYEPGSTDVWTPADEALAQGRGVCQDFAHVLIGACRRHAIPARYVSGYLHDPELADEHSASHAWVDVFVDGRGWFSLDPTHDREQTDHYVRIAVGRDYADVPPTRGVFNGNATERLEVSVRVRAL
jgi:transglutaminase-like putative cysteine protease